MAITIRNRSSAEIFNSETAQSIVDAVNEAVKRGTGLSGADLRSANLSSANLSSAYLSGANLNGANLRDANLSDANLSDADLSDADLSWANLSGANLFCANLNGADLNGANLNEADLSGANLNGAKYIELVIAQTRILPEGDLIGWKKCMDNVIVKLRIPEDSKRSNAFGRKCRAEFADVLEVFGAEVGLSRHDGTTEYRPGHRVQPDNFDPDWTRECSSGIHFYITRKEAEEF